MRLVRSTALIMSAAALATAGVAFAQDGGEESSKEPAAIVSDAARDLSAVKSFHFAGTEVDQGTTVRLVGDAFANGTGRVTLTQGRLTARFVELPGVIYIKANKTFWRETGERISDRLAGRLADRWIRQPSSKDLSLVSELTPKKLAKCLTGSTGTMSKAGSATVSGQQAIVLRDAGDKPGTYPGRYYFTDKAPVLLLRVVQTGKVKPGRAKAGSCEDGDDTSTRSDVTFSRFGKVAKVTAPHGAVTPEQAAGGGTGDAPSTPA
jgi:hypothetical protein